MTMANTPTPPDTPREVETVEPAGLDSTVPQVQPDAPAVPARAPAASPDVLRFDDVVSGAFVRVSVTPTFPKTIFNLTA